MLQKKCCAIRYKLFIDSKKKKKKITNNKIKIPTHVNEYKDAFQVVHPDFFLMRRIGISRAYTKVGWHSKRILPGKASPYPVKSCGGAECRKRNGGKKKKVESVTIEWYYYWTFCCEK